MKRFIQNKMLVVRVENSSIDKAVILANAKRNGAGLISSNGNRLRKIVTALDRKKTVQNGFPGRIFTNSIKQFAGYFSATHVAFEPGSAQNAGKEFSYRSAWINQHGKALLVKFKFTEKMLWVYFYDGNNIVRLQFLIEGLLKDTRPGGTPDQTKAPKEKSVLQRAAENPIIQPVAANRWESDAVFNAGALYLDNKVHLIYRAIGESSLSVFGYASSDDGTHISERAATPSFVCGTLQVAGQKNLPRYPYSSGGSWWGSEDPRITRVDDIIYMTYTAFDGHHPPCVALTSIKVDDFLNKEWNWQAPKLISQPGVTNKNWVVFPEKINGKFAVLHSITPQVLIAYRDSMDFEDGNFISSHYHSKGREAYWDNWIRGVGPPPIKTSEGWLVLYHAMDRNDPDRYKIGAMLLDEKEPEKILCRSNFPLLEPDQWYENDGHKKGVVYTCGAVLLGEKLFVYYGGADNFLCAAMIDLNVLLRQLKNNAIPSMHPLN